MSAASSPLRALSSSRKANITCCRFAIEKALQVWNPRTADAIAASISARSARATSAVTAPVAGL
jgi:hypothetical protein